MKLTKLSASRIKTFEQCQLKYKAVYEDELPEPPPHPLTNMGSAVHQMFEFATRSRMRANGSENPMDYRDAACGKFKVLPEHLALVNELTANALRWGYFRDRAKHCVGVEVEVGFELADGTGVTGYIDRLDVRPPEATVIDLKTQKKAFTTAELDENWQARIYNIGARRLRPEVTGRVKVAFWVLRHQVQPVWLTADDASRDEEALLEVARRIRDCDDPQPSPSPLCNWCPAHGSCPFEREGVKSRLRRRR